LAVVVHLGFGLLMTPLPASGSTFVNAGTYALAMTISNQDLLSALIQYTLIIVA